jgi:capsular exopolysaccharide synthesis family protein
VNLLTLPSTSQPPGAGAPEDGQGTLQRIIPIIRRNIGLILLCIVLVPAAAIAFSLLQSKEYTASSSLLFRDPGLDVKFTGTPFFREGEDEARLQATNVRLVSLEAMATLTADKLGKPGFGRKEVSEAVEVTPEGTSDVVTIKATDTDPEFAAQIANTFAREYVVFRREADRAKIRQAHELVERRLAAMTPEDRAGSAGQDLEDSARQLELLTALQTGNAEVVQRARPPETPSSPKPVRSAAIGLILGLLLAAAATLIREQVDRRLRDPGDVSDILNVPVLALIPEDRSGTRNVTAADTPLRRLNTEAFMMLRANLRYFNVDEELNSILIMSAGPEEGKTSISWNLARAEARAGKRVLCIEADLRRPTLARHVGTATDGGLSLVLAGVMDPTDAITTVSGVDVITAGPLPPNPAELIESQRMRKLIQWGEKNYDRVIIDSPPAAVVADAIPMVPMVSGVVIVVRLGHSQRDAVGHLRTQLANVNAPVLGVVLNGGVGPRSDYTYARRPVFLAEAHEPDAGGRPNGDGPGIGAKPRSGDMRDTA